LIMKPDLVAPGSHIRSTEAVDSYLSKTYPARHVSGNGPNAVMQLSGTSMAAGFVSGAAALVLDTRGSLTPRETRVALQLTSTFMPSVGLVGAGAGMINALAAVQLAATGEIPTSTSIAGEEIVASRKFSATVPSALVSALVQGRPGKPVRNPIKNFTDPVPWGNFGDDTTMWGTWESNAPVWVDTIVWGIDANTIVWGGADASTIVWGANATTIVWGVNANTIVWGVNANTIVWGIHANTIVWGINASTIVWGANADTIVWGVDANTIVWGIDASTIVWGGDE